MKSPQTVLVTGAAGFFGLAITRALTMAGMAVIATDRASADEFQARSGSQLEFLTYVQRDLVSESVGDLIASVSTVVHAAALTPGPDERGETLDALLSVNLTPLPRVLEAIRRSDGCSRLVFVSSAGVYDQGVDGVLNEDAADGGSSMYGAAKLAAEFVVGRYATISGFEFCHLRPTALFGPGETVRPSRPGVTQFCRLVEAAQRGDLVRVENPMSRRDWLHVDDGAAAVVALVQAEELPGCALNLSSGVLTPLGAMVDTLQRTVGLRVGADADVVISGGSDHPARMPNGRLRAAVPWSPRLTFADAAVAIMKEGQVTGDGQ